MRWPRPSSHSTRDGRGPASRNSWAAATFCCTRTLTVKRATEPEFGIAFSKLLAAGSAHRVWATRLAANAPGDGYITAVVALARDQDPLVRQHAAAGLARLALADRGGAVVRNALREAAADPGRAVPIAVAAELEVPRRPSRGSRRRANVAARSRIGGGTDESAAPRVMQLAFVQNPWSRAGQRPM